MPYRRMSTPLPNLELLEQLQVQPHAIRKEPLSAADDRGADDHLELVDKIGHYRLRGEFRAINGDVVLDVGFEPTDRVGIELPLNARPCAARLGYAELTSEAESRYLMSSTSLPISL
jgi:hypothetical protein